MYYSIKRPPRKHLYIFSLQEIWFCLPGSGHLFPAPANWKYKTNFPFTRRCSIMLIMLILITMRRACLLPNWTVPNRHKPTWERPPFDYNCDDCDDENVDDAKMFLSEWELRNYQQRICIWFERKLSLAFAKYWICASSLAWKVVKILLNDFPAKYLNLSDFRLSGITGQKYLKL